MNSSDIEPPEDPDELSDAVRTMRVFTGLALFGFARHGNGLRDQVARNFVARGMTCLDSILLVWKAESEQDALILHRTLLDRLFHLHSLAAKDDFAEFDDFSFKAMYEARNRLASTTHPIIKSKLVPSLKQTQKVNRARYEKIIASGTTWHRPKAKDVAKDMDLDFLYSLGYDFASTHVHPMANDGESDFRRLTLPTQSGPLPDATVVRNSILAQALLTQLAFSVSSLLWRRIAFNFLDHILDFLKGNSINYRLTFVKIAEAGPDFSLCKPSEA